jgi:uncharacterized protein involved in exopolysaccharide biosynthesis
LTGLPAPSAVPKIGADRLATEDLLKILWRGRISVIAITGVITAITAAAAFLIPPKYEATVLLLPVSDMESPDRAGGFGSAVSQLGGLASLAGLSSSGNALKIEAIATLESEALTDRYISDNNLLPVLYRSKWDAVRMQWKSGDPKSAPTLWKANRYFRSSIRSVVDNARTGLVALTITWRDPKVAAKWANDLVGMTNEYLRNKAIDEAERNISVLQDEAKKSSVVSVQQAISSLTESQLKRVMLARSREQYALKVLDPATVAEKPSSPQPAIWIPAAFFISLFISIMFVLLRASDTPQAAPK